MDEISNLLQPPNASQFLKVEEQGLWTVFDSVLSFAYGLLVKMDSMEKRKKNNSDIKEFKDIFNAQMISYSFATAITMRKHETIKDGTDKTVELNSLKMLARSTFWSTNLKILGLNAAHIEYKRSFLRLLTLMLNWNSCGLYILNKLTDLKGNKEHKEQIDNLIVLCDDAEDSFEANALQGLANQCFCQLYAHCERVGRNKELKKYLDSKKNMYFSFAYGMARAQMEKGTALSMNESKEILKKAGIEF